MPRLLPLVLLCLVSLSCALSAAEEEIQDHIREERSGKQCPTGTEELKVTGYGTCRGVCADRLPDRLLVKEAYCNNCMVGMTYPEQYTCICCVRPK
jgi:hypothetical protein